MIYPPWLCPQTILSMPGRIVRLAGMVPAAHKSDARLASGLTWYYANRERINAAKRQERALRRWAR